MINLVASLSLKDNITQPLRQVTSQMNALTRIAGSVGGSMTSLGSAIGRQANQLTGLKTQLAGVAGAYVGAQGAMKAFNSTIGAAARFEQQEVAVKAIFNDDEASAKYLEMVNKMALDSPLLNSTDMLNSSKGLVAMTKNVDDLGKAWSIIERLQVLDPTQGTDGAAFALKEMWQGDALSMVERFGLDKKQLNEIKKLDIPSQISAISGLLDGMNVTQATVDAMGNTTLGYWMQIGERAESFMRSIGKMSNSKIGDILGGIVKKIDSIDLDSMALKIDAVIGNSLQKAIDFGKRMWELRAPILEGAKAFGTFALAVGGIVTVAKTVMGISSAFAFLVSPIGLIATGITGLVFGFKRLYESSDTFKAKIDGIVGKGKELYKAFKADGVKGVLDAILPEGVVGKITEVISTVKSVVGTVVSWLKTKFDEIKPSLTILATKFLSFKDTVINAISTLFTIASPILSALWSVIQIVGDVASLVFNNIVVPAIVYAMQVIQTLWTIAQPILVLLAEAIEFAFGALKVIWDNVLKPFVEWILGMFKGALETLGDAMKTLGDNFGLFKDVFSNVWDSVVKTAETAVNGVINLINALIETINAIPLIEIDAVANVNWSGDALGAVNTNVTRGMTPGHYHGLDSVPYDGYVARLHRGEEVLNAQEAKVRREGGGSGGSTGGVSIAKLADQIIVREDADIEKFAYQLAKYIESESVQA